ncbi:MAG: thioesterase domain-containing protein [Gammaproteobacteria bacterium]|nr:thioesterase domain-containing protein [Gammaproteobacteria bacterium]MDH5692341.1 thioesterase domain-containing protein [Gammaproteobacteria bacterium]
MDQVKALTELLHHEIPLTEAMGLKAQTYDGNSLSLFAPLEPNRNHKSTAFGGSLYSVAVLTGWGLLQLKLSEAEISGQVVIQKSSAEYLLPVKSGLVSQCEFVDTKAWERMKKTLQRRTRARLSLRVRILSENGETAMLFEGDYVVHKTT